ncbi:MAG: hypothetical protein LUQ50_08325 [Methanospirillum sp.]|uniref:hypothetical protein n=1 Tax=Methanospirillum sp. TaxID=45200 RepID=UPI00236B67F6|nr:hypothetical protein [Methanospirillum sp.]MDD1729062.1 hypothetical protein [Methanospirillum sp.]
MAALLTGNRPPRLHVDRDQIPVQSGKRVKTEILTITNDGGGVLKGSAIADVNWIRIPNPRIETPFIIPLRIEITPDRFTAGSPLKGTVTIITNGGTAKVFVEYFVHPVTRPGLTLDEQQYLFCNLKKGDDFSFDLILRNTGSGLLSGTIESGSDWIEVKNRTIWTHTIQAVPVIIHTSIAPKVRHPTGRIRIRSSGGTLEVPVSIHFRSEAGPVLRLSPSRIRCVWEKRGIIEETLTAHNEGAGILRGTIPSPVPWLKITPSIFSAEKNSRILFRIDTRMLKPDVTISIPISIITNTGTHPLTLEVIPGKKPVTQVRKTRSSARHQTRTRLVVYEPDGRMCTLVSTGKAGGEGEIYYLAGDETRCAKIFHPHRRTQEIEEKIHAMTAAPPDPELLQSLTWPLMPVTDLPRGGKIVGYLMRRIPEEEFRSVHLWYDQAPTDGEKDLQARIIAARKLANLVAGVHRAGHVIGDLRENNLLINNQGDLILIDTDSFQIREAGGRKIYWSRMGTGEYLPPEHLDGSFAEAGCDRRYGDHFALAVLIFRFLMDGVHPFQAKGPLVRNAPATTDKILLGHFAFESRINGISPPDYAPPYSSLPSRIRALFKEVFVSGHRSPRARPDASQWEKVLSTLVHDDRRKMPEPEPEKAQNSHHEPCSSHTGWLSDGSGHRISPGRCLYRTGTGTIRAYDENNQIFLLNSGVVTTGSMGSGTHLSVIPPSLILPTGFLQKGNIPAGWIIPRIDPDRFLPWHMLTDPQSRIRSNRTDFSFNKRIASCRNLMAALISAKRSRIGEVVLSERTVFVGPDASIRILCLPDMRHNNQKTSTEGESPVVLIFRMLMNGYHPFHAIGSRAAGSGSHERRMAAGLYPWREQDPDLDPPPGAPSISILPGPLAVLFDEEFSDFEGNTRGNIPYEAWFETLDQVFRELIGCTSDPDHWYLPGYDGCPWCTQEVEHRTVIPRELQQQVFPLHSLLLIAAPKVAGLLLERNKRRSTRKPDATRQPGWVVIPLPPERVSRILLPKIVQVLLLPSEISLQCHPEVVPFLPITGIRIPEFLPGLHIRTKNQILLQTEDLDQIHGMRTGMEDITLLDEMLWVSALDRLRGENIGKIQKTKNIRTRQTTRTRNPIQIMLLPLYLPTPEPEKIPDEQSRRDLIIAEIPSQKARKRRGIRKKLQTILMDFIGSDSDQDP